MFILNIKYNVNNEHFKLLKKQYNDVMVEKNECEEIIIKQEDRVFII